MGGAASCEACRLEKRDREAFDGQSYGDGCYLSLKTGKGGECVFQCPPVLPSLVGLWGIWESTRNAVVRAGIDAVPISRDLNQVIAVATALGEPTDERFFDLFAVVEMGWLLQEAKKPKPKK